MNYIKLVKTISLLGLGGVVAVLLLTASHTAAQSKGSASFSIASETHTVNDVFPVSIYLDSGGMEVNVMAVDLQYDPGKLEFVHVEQPPAGLMGAGGPPEHKAGSVYIPRMSGTNGVKGKILFAVVQFRVLTSGGTTALTLGSQTEVYANGDNVWDGKTGAATITLAAAPASQPEAKAKPAQNQRSSASKTATNTQQADTAQTTDTAHKSSDVGPVQVSVIGSGDSQDSVPAAAIGAMVGIMIAAAAGAGLSRRKHAKHHAHKKHHTKGAKHG